MPYRMRRVTWTPTGALMLALLLAAALVGPAGAQDATPTVTVAVTRVTATPVPTATVTRTPTVTPSPTPTLTAFETQLALAHAYLAGGDTARAIEIYSALVARSQGDPAALAGLNEALAAQAGATATAAAPTPTLAAPTPAVTPAPGFGDVFAARGKSMGATALALILVIGAVYALLRLLRWLFGRLRELWLTRIRPLFGRPPIAPSVAVTEFVDASGAADYVEPEVVAQTIEETLVRWNLAVPPELITPVHTRPLDRAGLSWLGALWAQVSPPPRMILITGLLLGDQPGPYRLSVERLDLRTNSVSAAHTFEARGTSPETAFRMMAEMAAYWLRDPGGMERTPGLLAAFDVIRAASAAVALLIPVRQQVNAESVDYATAPKALDDAQALVSLLPAGSSLRADLQATVDDLRAKVQPGRA